MALFNIQVRLVYTFINFLAADYLYYSKHRDISPFTKWQMSEVEYEPYNKPKSVTLISKATLSSIQHSRFEQQIKNHIIMLLDLLTQKVTERSFETCSSIMSITTLQEFSCQAISKLNQPYHSGILVDPKLIANNY